MDWHKNGLTPKNAAATSMGKANPSRNTRPEVELRSQLHSMGYRFRCHYKIDDGELRAPRVDFAFPRLRLAVQVNGSFWHGKKKEYRPKHNTEYWEAKFRDNQERDKRVTRRLRRAGWSVVTVWDDWTLDRQVRAVVRKLSEKLSEVQH